VFCKAFLCLNFLYAIFWCKEISAKAARKMSVKLTNSVNLTNILQETLQPIFYGEKIQTQTVNRENLLITLLYVVKLTTSRYLCFNICFMLNMHFEFMAMHTITAPVLLLQNYFLKESAQTVR
jgi:hypothetical protein